MTVRINVAALAVFMPEKWLIFYMIKLSFHILIRFRHELFVVKYHTFGFIGNSPKLQCIRNMLCVSKGQGFMFI